jgi:hypothetical protein
MMPMFMLISDILCICMLLICHLCFITTMFMREGDQVKPWPRSNFGHKKIPLLLVCCFTFSSYTQKSQKYWLLVPFGFVNLQDVSSWQTPQLVGDTKLLFFCCRLFEECGERTTFSSTRVWYKSSTQPCGENFSCCITLCLESLSGI